jgi:hypothetical protein
MMTKNKASNNEIKDRGIHPEIKNLNFDRIKNKLMITEDGEKWTIELCDIAEREYKRLLTLIKLYPKTNFVPTKLMDKFWHQHILDTIAYKNDCENVFGFFLHHFPYFGIYGIEDAANLSKEFVKTQAYYLENFNEQMTDPVSSRCEDHACHVESDCACRVSGACKNH